MTQPEKNSILGRAFGRAAADINSGADRQADALQLIRQIADVKSVHVEHGSPVWGDGGETYVVVAGAHNAGFRIAIAITPDGRIGWTLV